MIDVDHDGVVRLQPAASWDVHGDVDESSWRYRVNTPAPSSTVTKMVDAAGVVHPRFETDPARPWRGVSPLESAVLAGRLSAETAAALGDESSMPRGAVVPLPIDGGDPTLDSLKADLRGLSGKLAFVESVKTMAGGAASNAPAADWKTQRLGAEPPAALVELYGAAGADVLAACGVPATLFATGGDGAGRREAMRAFAFSTLAPLGAIVSGELSTKLEADVSLSFDRLFAADVSGRARAFQSMVGGGMDVSKAAALAGLMESDG